MKYGQIISINIGKPTPMQYNKKNITTSIFKKPVYNVLGLNFDGFVGDFQSELKYHGGKDKAVCVYSYEHYPYWEQELERSLYYGAFGENLTIFGFTEPEVCIGDIFQLGSAIVQISQPRQPCFKLAARYHSPLLPIKFQQSGLTGYYLRVLQPGEVSYKDELILLHAQPQRITVALANQIMHHYKHSPGAVEELLNVNELSASWRTTLQKRRLGIKIDSSERLTSRPPTINQE
ncbi:MOSC domain-containing protein [Paenibacillus glycanilyticus]|uniref:MOSC domain-containing protein n=1 Tax=Paenibacillus glycanilyticus TaxID=126569 RepID=UPI00191009C2|nr:MOSC domain-containing protein [Paenibacillus glycanilyticus]